MDSPYYLKYLRALVMLVVIRGTAPAADDVRQNVKAMEDAAAKQRQAVAAQQKSLDAQRQAIRKQIGQQPGSSFFLLPPPVPLPGSGLVPFLSSSNCPPLSPGRVDTLVTEAALREQVQPELLRSVIRQESAFRPCAISARGAMGLMQLMPDTASQFGVTDPLDPQENVDAGARFLKQLLGMYGGDLPLALGAFNAGPGRVTAAGGIPPIPQTLDYVHKVLSFLPVEH